MEYILTEEEYDNLKQASKQAKLRPEETINALCKEVATWKQIKIEGLNYLASYGCIQNDINNPEVCDECPVESICTYQHKEFSQ